MAKPLAWLLLLLPTSAFAESGTLFLHRWNLGFRAEKLPAVTEKISYADFQAMISQNYLPKNEALYTGCYLAYFTPEKAAREPASENGPKTSIFRICANPKL